MPLQLRLECSKKALKWSHLCVLCKASCDGQSHGHGLRDAASISLLACTNLKIGLFLTKSTFHHPVCSFSMLFISLELSTHFGLPWGSAVLADPLGQGEPTMLNPPNSAPQNTQCRPGEEQSEIKTRREVWAGKEPLLLCASWDCTRLKGSVGIVHPKPRHQTQKLSWAWEGGGSSRFCLVSCKAKGPNSSPGCDRVTSPGTQLWERRWHWGGWPEIHTEQ